MPNVPTAHRFGKFSIVAAIGLAAAMLIPVVAMAATTPTYTLMSTSSSRGSGVALSGLNLTGNVYIIMTPTTGVTKASFWLDNTAMSGTATHVEGSAPLDFVGTDTAGNAKPWDTTKVAAGTHTITSLVVTSSATTSFTTTFTVRGTSPTPTPTATPGSAGATKKPHRPAPRSRTRARPREAAA
jgi:hypothetical protein